MFETLHATLRMQCAPVAQRADGVAFLSSKRFVRIGSISYVCINISVSGRARYFAHCIYSDTCVEQFASNSVIPFEMKSDNKAGTGSVEPAAKSAPEPFPHIVLALNKRRAKLLSLE